LAGSLRGKADRGVEQAHYTHQRILGRAETGLYGDCGRPPWAMSLEALEAEIAKGDVGTVVMTFWYDGPWRGGSAGRSAPGYRAATASGCMLMGATGGNFRLIRSARRAGRAGLTQRWTGRIRSSSIRTSTGLQPFGCGCVLVPDPAVGRFLQARFAVYVLHIKAVASGRDQPGVSRAGRCGDGFVGHASAFAAEPGASLPRLKRGRAAAVELDPRLRWTGESASSFWLRGAGTRLLCVEDGRGGVEQASRRAQEVLWAAHAAILHLALVQLPEFVGLSRERHRKQAKPLGDVPALGFDEPEHEAWLDRIWERLTAGLRGWRGE